MYSRRDFARIALASLPAAAALGKPGERINGVLVGVQSYSFRDRPLDEAIQAMREIGLTSCELWDGHVAPKVERNAEGEARLKQWRESAPLGEFQAVGRKFKEAGIQLFALTYGFRENYTDQEIEHGFRMAKAMGVKYITASANVSVSRRVAPFAEKYKITVGMHNHSNLKDPNEFARPESFEEAMKHSKYIGVNLDLGHFTAAGFDAVAYTEKWADRMVCVHVKDRKKDQGDNVPFGEGDTPIKQVLQLMKQKKYKFPANIEYEYKGTDTVAEVRKCLDYCRQALA